MIKEITRLYAESRVREDAWHDARKNTGNASEIGNCIRKAWFGKNDIPGDPGFVQRYGALERGNLIERHWFVPALRAFLPPHVELLYAGDEQRAIVDGYLSATADSLLVNLDRDCLAHLGIPDIGPSRCLVVECKSVDPRVDLRKAKQEHEFQTHAQMGLIRATTEHQPDYALIAYIDASFLDDVTEFVVKFDLAIYQAAHDRARRIMTAVGPAALRPEGKMAGGAECRYCAWASNCSQVTVAGIPYDDKNPALDESAVEELARLARVERNMNTVIQANEEHLAELRQKIKDFLREHGIRRYHADDWSVSWSSAAGRETVDIKAAEAAGIDLSPYRKEGTPGDRLVVKVK